MEISGRTFVCEFAVCFRLIFIFSVWMQFEETVTFLEEDLNRVHQSRDVHEFLILETSSDIIPYVSLTADRF